MSLKERLNLNNGEAEKNFVKKSEHSKYDEIFEKIINENQNVIICCPFDVEQSSVFCLSDKIIAENKRVVAIGKNLEFKRNEIIKFEPDFHNSGKNLVKTALELNPFKLILQDFAGYEAVDILKLTNAGIKNVITSVMAESCEKALNQIELNLYMSGMNIPENLMKKLISSFVNYIVEIEKIGNTINVSKICKIKTLKNNEYVLEDMLQQNKSSKKDNKKFDIKGFEHIEEAQIPAASKIEPDILAKKLKKPSKKNILAAKLKNKNRS